MADAYLQSGEETLFGEFIEGLAIFTRNQVYGAEKIDKDGSGMDFKFEKKMELFMSLSVKQAGIGETKVKSVKLT